MESQNREQRALPRAAKTERPIFADHLQRAENLNLHAPFQPPLAPL